MQCGDAMIIFKDNSFHTMPLKSNTCIVSKDDLVLLIIPLDKSMD